MAKLPVGTIPSPGKRKIAVVFDAKVFDDIIARCKKEDKDFSTVANDVAKCGLFDLAEAGE